MLPDSRRRSPYRMPTALSHVDTPRADRDELIRDRDTGHCLIGGRGSARLPRSLLRAGHLRAAAPAWCWRCGFLFTHYSGRNEKTVVHTSTFAMPRGSVHSAPLHAWRPSAPGLCL